MTFLVAAPFTLAAGTFSGMGPALRMEAVVGVRPAWGVGAGEEGGIDLGMAVPLVGIEVLDVGGGAGDDMGVEDALRVEGLGPALRKGAGEGRTGLGLEVGLGVIYWGLVVTAGWLSVVLRALTMKAGNENSWLLVMDSTTRIGLSAVLGVGVKRTGLGLEMDLEMGMKAWVLVLTPGWLSAVLPALAM